MVEGGRAAASRRAAGADRAASPPAPSPNITYEKEHRARSSSTRRSSSSSRYRVERERRRRRSSCTPDPDGLLHLVQRRRPVRHLLRRQPPALRRQRRQGDGVGEGRLSARGRRCSPTSWRALDPAAQPRARRGVARARRRGSTTSSLAHGRGRRAADADDRRGDRAARRPRRGTSSPGQFYRLQNFESLAPRVRRRHAAADGRHRAHRRVGRQGAGAAVADRARDGRVEPAVRATCSRASRSS